MNLLQLVPSRLRNSVQQFGRFGMVGAVGVVVNNLTVIASNVIGRQVFQTSSTHVFWDLPGTAFNVRNYHLYVMLAFLVASMSNFVMNRHWTFRSDKQAPFWHEYVPFLMVGLAAQFIGLGLMTLLMHPDSPIGLSDTIFDGSNGFRTKLYWANLIMIGFVTPINFVFNKLWTFRHVRHRHHSKMEERERKASELL